MGVHLSVFIYSPILEIEPLEALRPFSRIWGQVKEELIGLQIYIGHDYLTIEGVLAVFTSMDRGTDSFNKCKLPARPAMDSYE